MKTRLATKISLVIVAVIASAVLSSLVTVLIARQVTILLSEIVRDNLPGIRAAEELEIAILEQKGILANYMLDRGNSRWLEELRGKQGDFAVWLARARQTAPSDEDRQLLDKLASVYQEYSTQRDAALKLFEQGKAEQARELLLGRVRVLYYDAYGLCEKFIEGNVKYAGHTETRVQRAISFGRTMMTISVGLTIVLSLALLWLFFRGILIPLRQLVADAASFAGDDSPHRAGSGKDELDAVGVYLRSLMSDVADTRSLLEQSRHRLISAEKLATVGKLAASVAHEIRNPLTAIKMWLFSLQKAVGGDEAIDRRFAIVSGEMSRLESIIRNFLEFSRPPALKLQPHDIAEVLERTLELVSHRMEDQNLRLVSQVADGLPPVLIDPDQLRQVLLNLLNNAADASPEGGEIRVMASRACDPGGRDMVVVRIRDTGKGMADDAQQRVFEPFFTTKEEGTGLGLCIAARIMARHEGRLVLESSTSCGTCFSVWLPLARGRTDE